MVTAVIVAVIFAWQPLHPAGEPVAQRSATETAPATSYPSGTTSPSPLSPAAALNQEVSADRATAESLVGNWVPQISSKKEGLVADGVTYDDALIWADFERSRATHSDAALVSSDDFSSFRRPGYWVTIIAENFSTAAGANNWCAQQGYGVNDCYAKRLSHTDGPSGNTVLRS